MPIIGCRRDQQRGGIRIADVNTVGPSLAGSAKVSDFDDTGEGCAGALVDRVDFIVDQRLSSHHQPGGILGSGRRVSLPRQSGGKGKTARLRTGKLHRDETRGRACEHLADIIWISG